MAILDNPKKAPPKPAAPAPVQPIVSNAPLSNNPFLNAQMTGLPTSAAQPTVDKFGLSTTDEQTVISAGGAPAASVGPWTQQAPGSSSMDLDPFGIGVPVQTDLAGSGYTVQQLLTYIQSLSPDQIAQVQADLANAGYYGPMNSYLNTQTGTNSEPTWGMLGAADFAAIGSFAKDLIANANNGTNLSSLLALRTQQWNQQQRDQLSTQTPVKDLGKNYTITNLDPNEALDMVDKSSMSVFGRTTGITPQQRQQMATWLNTLYVNRQMSADQGDIAQNSMNAQATAQSSDFINPLTGKALDFNGITATARSQMGVNYQWGAQSPGQAFDCSGLTQWVYGQNGIKIPRTSQEQWQQGTGSKFTDMSQAQPGDLVFFVGGDGTSTAPGHVGIYIGNGMMIDAPHTGSSVRIDNVQSFGGLVGFEHYGQSANTTIQSTNMPPGTAPAGSSVAGSGGSNEQSAYEFLVGKGLSPAGAAGIVGNLMQESNVNPEEPGGGIAQWTGGRWNSTLQTGNAQTDLNNQLNYLWNEMSTKYPGLVQQLQSTTDPGAAAQAFESTYEVAGVPNNPARVANAQSIFNSAQSGGWGGGGGPSTGDPGSQVASSEGLDANGGRSIVSTPNTFTQAYDESSTALQDTLDAQMRATNPALANANDFSNAYSMLAKALRDGITVNNS